MKKRNKLPKILSIYDHDFLINTPSLLSISDFDKENKATSAPDIIAERISNTQNPMTPEIKAVFTLKNKNNRLWGSGSKFKQIN